MNNPKLRAMFIRLKEELTILDAEKQKTEQHIKTLINEIDLILLK